jgi:hypothetical protein
MAAIYNLEHFKNVLIYNEAVIIINNINNILFILNGYISGKCLNSDLHFLDKITNQGVKIKQVDFVETINYLGKKLHVWQSTIKADPTPPPSSSNYTSVCSRIHQCHKQFDPICPALANTCCSPSFTDPGSCNDCFTNTAAKFEIPSNALNTGAGKNQVVAIFGTCNDPLHKADCSKIPGCLRTNCAECINLSFGGGDDPTPPPSSSNYTTVCSRIHQCHKQFDPICPDLANTCCRSSQTNPGSCNDCLTNTADKFGIPRNRLNTPDGKVLAIFGTCKDPLHKADCSKIPGCMRTNCAECINTSLWVGDNDNPEGGT